MKLPSFFGIGIKGVSEEPMRTWTFPFENGALMRGTLSCGGLVMMNIVTAKELDQYQKLSESTIYTLAAMGVLPGFKIGNSWRFDMREIQEVIRTTKRGNDGATNNEERRG
jgi:predicted DNA-binding transcriptional regulator AlpA